MKPRIEAALVARNEDGEWWHPDMPLFDEGQEKEYLAWIESEQLTVSRSWLEGENYDHPAYVACFDNGQGFAGWVDEPPSGDGWFTLAIFDTEDGPVWLWARRTEGGAE